MCPILLLLLLLRPKRRPSRRTIFIGSCSPGQTLALARPQAAGATLAPLWRAPNAKLAAHLGGANSATRRAPRCASTHKLARVNWARRPEKPEEPEGPEKLQPESHRASRAHPSHSSRLPLYKGPLLFHSSSCLRAGGPPPAGPNVRPLLGGFALLAAGQTRVKVRKLIILLANVIFVIKRNLIGAKFLPFFSFSVQFSPLPFSIW